MRQPRHIRTIPRRTKQQSLDRIVMHMHMYIFMFSRVIADMTATSFF